MKRTTFILTNVICCIINVFYNLFNLNCYLRVDFVQFCFALCQTVFRLSAALQELHLQALGLPELFLSSFQSM